MTPSSPLLAAHLQDWKNDLKSDWRDFFDEVALDLAALGDLKTADSHPLLKASGTSPAVGGVVPRHLTRAFDGLAPEKVRVVVIGEDPYPDKTEKKATGRAFEDGAWDKTRKLTDIADSLQPLLLSAVACEKPDLKLRFSAKKKDLEADWETVDAAIHAGALASPAAPGHFDALARQGVLFVNAAWTFTGTATEQKDAHVRAWKPVMTHLLTKLAQGDGKRPVVFLLLGEEARKLLESSVYKKLKTDGVQTVRLAMATVFCPHPSKKSLKRYFGYPNPLMRVNDALKALDDQKPVCWWPEAQSEPSMTSAEDTVPPARTSR